MKTIKERAKDYLSYERDFLGISPSDNMVCRAYCEGAKEQKAIDDKRYEEYLAYMSRELTNSLSFQRKTIIDKACEWITNHNGDDSVIEGFLKYMEE